MIIFENPQISDTSQRTIDPLHRARAPPPPRDARVALARRATRLLHPARSRLRVRRVRVSLSPLARAFAGRIPETPGTARDRPIFLGCEIIPSRARADARGGVTRRVDGGERFEATRSEGIGRRRARAAVVETRGARARRRSVYGRGRRRCTGARDVGGRRRAVRDPVRRARGVREARASVRTSIASATRATRATREGGAPVI